MMAISGKPEIGARQPNGEPGIARGRYPPRRKAGLTVFWLGRKACGSTTGPRLKRAPGPHQGSISFDADLVRWNGIRTRYLMISSHLLYPMSYPRMARSTGLEPIPTFAGAPE